MKIKRFGTRDDETQHGKAVPMDEVSVYRFYHGKYRQIFWKGYPKIKSFKMVTRAYRSTTNQVQYDIHDD